MSLIIATHEPRAAQTGVVLIPLNRLKKSPRNARKTPHGKEAIEALAASIHAKGMLQNLVVEPEIGESGAHTGDYLVQIGEGRRQAQLLRVKRKQIPDTEPIRCVVDTTNNPLETSVDENITRSAMSVMDEVEAFVGLADGGMNADDIARRFGCTVRLVEQRLALGRLSPKIRAAYRRGDVNLDAARAFAINDDHAAQERVFRQLAKPITHAPSVRNALTAGRIPADDRVARFVGTQAYEAAGGHLVRDLFEPDIFFFGNGELLQRLASDKLDALRAGLAKEGWGWVEAVLGHGQIDGCASERLQSKQRKLKPAEKQKHSELEARLAAIDEQLEQNDDDKLWTERDVVDTELDTLKDSVRTFDAKPIAHAGAMVTVDRDGRPVFTRGLIKRSDLKAVTKLQSSKSKAVQDDTADGATESFDNGPRLTKVLVEQLTKARTRGLRAALAVDPGVALGLIVYALMRQSADRSQVPGLNIAARPIGFDDDDGFEQARIAFGEQSDNGELALFGACMDLPVEKLLQALAIFVAETLDFTHAGVSGADKRMQQFGDALAMALDLDMTTHWEATQEFWEAAPKSLAITAIEASAEYQEFSDAKRKAELAALHKSKKSSLATKAASVLQNTGWLPDLLITPPREGAFAVTNAGKRALEEPAEHVA